MNLRTTTSGHRRSALLLAAAASGAVLVSALSTGSTPAHAAAEQPVSVASQLGLAGATSAAPSAARDLSGLSASRSQRLELPATQAQAAPTDVVAAARALQQVQPAAVAAKQAADQAAAQAAAQKAAADAAAQQAAAQQAAAQQAAAQQAAAQQAAAQQAAQKAAAAKAAAAPQAASSGGSGSFPAYALSKLGGDQSQFSCLQNLWGKESGWNPNAQNSSSTAYGIPQFLDSTWAGTGIAKTSNGYRQIDAGLIYIDSRYGSPCGAWAHSRAYNWY
jgi:hypothetical protein